METRLRGTGLVLAGLVLALMTAACGGDAQAGDPPGVNAAGEIDVEALVRFVEESRDREFASEPDVKFVDQIGSGPAGPWSSRDWEVLRLTGIIPADSDRAAANAVASQGISGLCCPVQVVQVDDPIVTASVAVHELVHLLDRDLITRPSSLPPLIDIAHTVAIVEGNAARVQEQFLRAHGLELGAARDAVEVPPAMPLGLVDLITVSYTQGAELSSQIVAEGGESAMDDAYGRHPVSAEQVMFPAAYFDNELPVLVDAPVLDGDIVPLRTGTLGTFVLEFMIPDGETDVLRQWSGDTYVLWEVDGRACITATVVMDSADGASALVTAIAGTVTEMSATAEADQATLERCLPAS